ncbi:hypothetical protein [Nocardia sp. NPDC049707]|uniref:hypothetical protein n=1 Tax=Nocardia sp. NPDC049707 TaxID=3154735 RepID=UPI00343B6E62
MRMRPTPGWVPDNELQLAVDLIDEEFEELKLAIHRFDMIEVADAIADGMYVTSGLLLRLGLARTYINDLLREPIEPPTWIHFNPSIMGNLRDRHEQLFDAMWSRNLIDVDVTGHQLMYLLSELALMLRIPLMSTWAEVQRSNLAKLVDGKVIRHPQTNKIMKPTGWRAPDIAGVLSAHGWSAAA